MTSFPENPAVQPPALERACNSFNERKGHCLWFRPLNWFFEFLISFSHASQVSPVKSAVRTPLSIITLDRKLFTTANDFNSLKLAVIYRNMFVLVRRVVANWQDNAKAEAFSTKKQRIFVCVVKYRNRLHHSVVSSPAASAFKQLLQIKWVSERRMMFSPRCYWNVFNVPESLRLSSYIGITVQVQFSATGFH